jgi:hypothetical protein
MLACLVPSQVYGQSLTTDSSVLAVLHFVSREEIDSLPQPNQWNPSYWSWPDYARTPSACREDKDLHAYLVDRVDWTSTPATLVTHHQSLQFVSARYKLNANAVYEKQLTDEQIGFVRRYLMSKVRMMNVDQEAMMWVTVAAGVPAVPVSASIAYTIWLVSSGATISDAYLKQPYKDGVNRLEGRLHNKVRAYRIFTLLKDNKQRNYLRISYALYTEDKSLYVLSRCYYSLEGTSSTR